jgi:hypothetical protein
VSGTSAPQGSVVKISGLVNSHSRNHDSAIRYFSSGDGRQFEVAGRSRGAQRCQAESQDLMDEQPGDYVICSQRTGHKMVVKADGSITGSPRPICQIEAPVLIVH